jgi:hypothetical protein
MKKLPFYNAFWKEVFSLKAGVLIAINSYKERFSKLIAWVKSYVLGKCTTVIVVNWEKKSQIIKVKKFRKGHNFVYISNH